MKFIKQELEVEKRIANIREGGVRDYFTEEEKRQQNEFIARTGQPFELEVPYTQTNINIEIRVEREYLEKKMGLMELLRIIKKLSKEQGAVSKQLYRYYHKMGASRMEPDVEKLYTDVEKIDISDPSNRRSWYSVVRIQYGKESYWYWKGSEYELGRIAEKHLSRCLAILIDKGYLTTTNRKFTRSYRRGSYSYSNTYYKLTDKALERLNGGR